MKEINSKIYYNSYFLKFLDAIVSAVATDLLHKPVYPQPGQPSNAYKSIKVFDKLNHHMYTRSIVHCL